ncbi:Protein CBG26380 [Caenorhabditis briggsae]|uniref:Protein CBG26380 n=1 Tax=Caenorhabditis briggsae TaxID=6238 RepID=B6IG46_CAEBR|nr:Protein CBG26380 [Caenorhabditis briggsae]CAR98876.1 Protein CBG26380 [Caenorhabditis briggsae]
MKSRPFLTLIYCFQGKCSGGRLVSGRAHRSEDRSSHLPWGFLFFFLFSMVFSFFQCYKLILFVFLP